MECNAVSSVCSKNNASLRWLTIRSVFLDNSLLYIPVEK